VKARFHEKEVFSACRTLFGPEVRLSLDFLGYLQAGGVKAAFREQAKQNHPDLFATHAPDVQNRQAEIFREVREAFDLIKDFLKHRDESFSQGADRIFHPSRPQSWSHPKRARKPATEHFYRGIMPLRRLEFGSYLYYRGLVSYQALIDALVWQRRQRPNLGDIACRWNWLSEADILKICRDRGGYGRFGEKAVALACWGMARCRPCSFSSAADNRKSAVISSKPACSPNCKSNGWRRNSICTTAGWPPPPPSARGEPPPRADRARSARPRGLSP